MVLKKIFRNSGLEVGCLRPNRFLQTEGKRPFSSRMPPCYPPIPSAQLLQLFLDSRDFNRAQGPTLNACLIENRMESHPAILAGILDDMKSTLLIKADYYGLKMISF